MLLAGALLLAGCVYLRLLEVKRQLADFDRHFKVDTREGLKLTFLEPVLLSKDMALLGLQAESRAKSGTAERWHFRWVKDRAPGDAPGDEYEQTADFVFVKRKLTTILVPEEFFAVFPKPLVLEGLRAAGRGKVDKEQRRLTSHLAASNVAGAIPPLAVANLQAMLGAPVETRGPAAEREWRYVFQAAAQDARAINIVFVVNEHRGLVQRIRGRMILGEFEFIYPTAPGPAPET